MEILSLVLLFTGRGRTGVYMYMYVYLGRRAWSRIVSAVVCVAASPARPRGRTSRDSSTSNGLYLYLHVAIPGR